jgi:hypothetical protein
MKKYLSTSRFLLCTVFLSLSFLVRAQTCYVTKTGSKYHLESCSYLTHSKIAYDYSKAIESGYAPCSRCKPTRAKLEAATPANAKLISQQLPKISKGVTTVQCNGKTKAGLRCKNMTKNTHGYCHVHSQ